MYVRALALVTLCALASALPFDGSKRISRIALGSCNNAKKPQPLWPEIASYSPDAFVWLGDITYADRNWYKILWLPGTNETLQDNFGTQKKHPGYQEILKIAQVVGVADDHDYGVNDADYRNPVKDLAQQVILDFLDEPADSPRRKQQGLNASYVWGSEGQRVKLILLDIRYHQNFEAQTILGEAQWEWFEQELKNNDAQLLIIGSGIQIITRNKFGAEGWKAFPRDRYRLFELLGKYAKDTAVFLVSGDVHMAEFARTHVCFPGPEDPSPMVLPLWELTTSGMTHSWANLHGTMSEKYARRFAEWFLRNVVTRGNRETLVGDTYLDLNWGSITIDWDAKPSPRLVAEVRGINNAVPLRFEFSFDDLKLRPLKPGEESVLRDCRTEIERRDGRPIPRLPGKLGAAFIIVLLLSLLTALCYGGYFVAAKIAGAGSKQQQQQNRKEKKL